MIVTRPGVPFADASAVDLATESVYRILAALFSDPGRTVPGCAAYDQVLVEPATWQVIACATELLRTENAGQPQPLGFGELPLEDLDASQLVTELRRSAKSINSEYTRAFGLVMCRECPPYETEYQPVEETFFRSQQMADVAGFYRAFGIDPLTGSHERPDHLALELEFMAFLLMKQRLAVAEAGRRAAEQAAECRRVQASFFRDHIAWWMPSFALALRKKVETGLFAEAARLLAAFLPVERARLTVAPPRMPMQASLIESPDECDGCLVQLQVGGT